MKNLILFFAVLFMLPACVNTSQTVDDNDSYSKSPCEASPKDPTQVEWMNTIIAKRDVTKVIRYDYNDKPVYFFKVTKCCDFQSYLQDCENNRICVDGGMTGGDCQAIFRQLTNETTIWEIDSAAE